MSKRRKKGRLRESIDSKILKIYKSVGLFQQGLVCFSIVLKYPRILRVDRKSLFEIFILENSSNHFCLGVGYGRRGRRARRKYFILVQRKKKLWFKSPA